MQKLALLLGPWTSFCMSLLCIFAFCNLFPRKPLPRVEAMLWDIGVGVSGAKGSSRAACLLPDALPCGQALSSNCILDLLSFNKERVISESVIA